MPDPTTPTPPPSRGGRMVATTAGMVAALAAVALLIAGLGLRWVEGQKDRDGYLMTSSERFSTGSYALATENLDIDGDGSDWLGPDQYGKVRVKASAGARPVFVGVARTRDADAYLSGTAHATVTDVSADPFEATYRERPGTRRPAPPAGRDIWVASAQGAGTRTVTWDARSGDWSIVVMNGDASRGVDARVSVGANVPVIGTLGWATLGGSGALALLAAGLLYAGARGPRRRGATADAPAPAAAG